MNELTIKADRSRQLAELFFVNFSGPAKTYRDSKACAFMNHVALRSTRFIALCEFTKDFSKRLWSLTSFFCCWFRGENYFFSIFSPYLQSWFYDVRSIFKIKYSLTIGKAYQC